MGLTLTTKNADYARMATLMHRAALAFAIGAVAAAAACSGSSPTNVGPNWIDEALQYVPDRPEYADAHLYVVNYAQLETRFGPELGKCHGSVEDPSWDEDFLARHMYGAAPPATPLFLMAPLPREIVGFDDCDLDVLLDVRTLDTDTTDFQMYAVSVEPAMVVSTLQSGGLQSDTIGSYEWLENRQREDGTWDSADLRRAGFRHVGVGPRVVLVTRSDAVLQHVANAVDDPSLSVRSRDDLSALASALREADALLIRSWKSQSLLDYPTPLSSRAQARARSMSDPRETLWASEWSVLAPPDRSAVAYRRDGEGRNVMKVALYYVDTTDAVAAVNELRTRMETYGDLEDGDDELCSGVEVKRPAEGGGHVVVGECVGEWARGWLRFERSELGVLLGPVP